MAPGARLVCRAVSTEDRANRARCDTHAAHRTGASAGTGNHLSQSSRCVSPPPGSESPENGSPRFGRTRVEDPARGYQGILRSIVDGLDWPLDAKTARHPRRVERELLAGRSARLHVLELLRSGKRKARPAL